MKPLAIDLYCGLGGWTEGLLAPGWDVIGFDIEQHAYDGERYPAQLVIQDVLTLHGSQFRTADLIVASPPCQAYSYMAMPWTRAKAKAAAIRADASGEELRKLTALFDACFRIQREACEASGRHIPMVVENVKGAQPWVGRARWSFGSFYLWGDLPALMPATLSAQKNGHLGGGSCAAGANPDGRRNPARGVAIGEGFKHRDIEDGYERTHPNAFGWKAPRSSSSAKAVRKAASAKIAKIPLALSTWIARTYYPREREAA